MNLNVPNSITFFRVVLVPVLMAFLLVDMQYGDIFALAVFVLAAASDSLDGYLARRFRQTTVMGAFLDPLADKLIVTAALVSLVQLGELSAWVAMVVIAREFAVTGLRMVAAAQKVVIPASRWGKAKTGSQMLAIAALIMEPRWLDPEWTLAGQSITWYLVLLMLVLTVLSGVDYFVHARQRLQPETSEADGARVETALSRTEKVQAGRMGPASDRAAEAASAAASAADEVSGGVSGPAGSEEAAARSGPGPKG